MASDDVCSVHVLISKHLELRGLQMKNPTWTIGRSRLGGRGVFATRDIDVDEVIFVDYPIVLGPRLNVTSGICVACFGKNCSRPCSGNCGLPVCSQSCEKSQAHVEECRAICKWKRGNQSSAIDETLLKCSTPIRSLFLSDDAKKLVKTLKSHVGPKHGIEVDTLKNRLRFEISEEDESFMRRVCSVLDANAFEVSVGSDDDQNNLRGLYPLGSLCNHDCSPNTRHVFDDSQRMIATASKAIQRGNEIFFSYSRLIWGTLTRQHHLLRSKHFRCMCERCGDPEEFGAHLMALKCRSCCGSVLPVDLLSCKMRWECVECRGKLDEEDVQFVHSVWGVCLMNLRKEEDPYLLLKVLKEKIPKFVGDNNQVAVELKYKLVWILGYKQGYAWDDLSEELINAKASICKDLLKLLQVLKTGQCKMRGLLLYELYCCLRAKYKLLNEEKVLEINNNSDYINVQEMESLVQESADILQYDVGATQEIKDRWKCDNILNFISANNEDKSC